MNVCTILTKNHLPHARVLAKSFRQHHPANSVFTALLLDDPQKNIDAEAEPFEMLRLEEIDVPELRGLPRYDAAAFADAVKPWLFEFLLERGAEQLIYLDPDIQLFAPLEEIAELANQHGLLLTSRVTEPIPKDGERPTETELLSSGVYDLGFIALGRGETTRRFLEWWSEGLLKDFSEKELRRVWANDKPLFGERKWVDLIPSLFPQMKVLRDPGYNLAYWNLHARTLQKDGTIVKVNGQRLKFFHFSGFRAETPYWLSKYATRVKVSESPVLAELCESYAALLKEHGYDEAIRTPYRYAQLPNGLPYDHRLHRLYRRALKEGESFGEIFEAEGSQAFVRWLNAPSWRGGRQGVTRFMHDGIYEERTDLQRMYKDLDGAGGARFVRWILEEGRREYDLNEQLLLFLPAVPETSPAAVVESRPFPEAEGVNVVGFLETGIGLGEAARGYVRALKAANIPVATRTTRAGVPGTIEAFDIGDDKGASTSPDENHSLGGGEVLNPYSTNLVCVNADQIPLFYEEVGEAFFENRRTIGVWAWETNSLPEEWLPSFDLVDELWVYTNYVAETLGRLSPVPVVVVPLPVTAPDPGGASVDLGLPEGFTFLFVFDFYSVSQRKNPLGLIEAFKQAFAPGEGPQLLLKSIHGSQWPEHLEQLKFAARDRSDIHIVDRYVSLPEKTALMASCDCYVSLHRAEGFGLTLAEAMALGKPVIATGYSGNLDFMNTSNSYLVDYTMTEIGEEVPIYSEGGGGTWAEPDLEQAARLMRQVCEDPEEARARGERGRGDIERMLSPEAVGQIARARLEHSAKLPTRFKLPPPNPSPPPLAPGKQLRVARGILKHGPDVGGASRLGFVGNFVRRLVLRGMRPFTFYQRHLDSALIDALREIEQRTVRGTAQSIEKMRSDLAHQHKQIARRQEQIESETRAHYQALEHRSEETIKGLHRMAVELCEVTDDLSEVTGGLRAKLDAGLPLLSYVDERGKKVLGFRDAKEEENGSSVEETATYRAFQDIFRGDERSIKERQAWYLELLTDRPWVLDVGCGRGEFLDLLRERGIKGKGVDADEGMVARCHAKGHDEVVLGDANAYLREQDDESVPAIFAAQVVEHLSYEELTEFLRLAESKLEAGGLLILETVNYHAPQALKAFWLDPSHQRPILPGVALALCRLAGFESGRVVFPGGSEDLEEELFSSLDYAVIATKKKKK